jgi:large subunit ribosomal protein L25
MGGHIFELELGGNKQYAMIKEVQYHPITDEIIHIDFMRVRREEKITISVPIAFVGESIGVNEGGVMMQSLTSLEVSCLPENVPKQVTIDITELEMNSSLTVADIAVSKEFDILTSNDVTVVSVQAPKEEEEPVVEEEEVLLDEEGVPIEEGDAEGGEKPVAEGEDAPQDKEADSG